MQRLVAFFVHPKTRLGEGGRRNKKGGSHKSIPLGLFLGLCIMLDNTVFVICLREGQTVKDKPKLKQ